MTAVGGDRGHVPALDGLRGIAAVIVVIRHCLNAMAMPAASRTGLFGTPLVLVLDAQGAVQLFFVLSGWVLAASLARSGERAPWPQFYVRRVLRIHPPYVAAVLFAWALSGFWRLPDGAAVSPWLAWAVVHPPAADVAASLAFPGRAAGLLRVGWTLRIEMIFSFALPLLALAAKPGRGVPLLAAAALGLTVRGSVVKYGIDFALGIVAFQQRAALTAAVARLPAAARALVPIVGVLLWVAPPALGHQREGPLEIASMGAGSVLLLISAAALPRVSGALSRRPFLFLGRVSYSVYLLHHSLLTIAAPLVLLSTVAVSQGVTWRAATPASGLALVALVVTGSILLSVPFHHFVERPAMAAGHRLSNRLAARRSSEDPPHRMTGTG